MRDLDRGMNQPTDTTSMIMITPRGIQVELPTTIDLWSPKLMTHWSLSYKRRTKPVKPNKLLHMQGDPIQQRFPIQGLVARTNHNQVVPQIHNRMAVGHESRSVSCIFYTHEWCLVGLVDALSLSSPNSCIYIFYVMYILVKDNLFPPNFDNIIMHNQIQSSLIFNKHPKFLNIFQTLNQTVLVRFDSNIKKKKEHKEEEMEIAPISISIFFHPYSPLSLPIKH